MFHWYRFFLFLCREIYECFWKHLQNSISDFVNIYISAFETCFSNLEIHKNADFYNVFSICHWYRFSLFLCREIYKCFWKHLQNSISAFGNIYILVLLKHVFQTLKFTKIYNVFSIFHWYRFSLFLCREIYKCFWKIYRIR